jgi:endonuclease/exonuclease/phosphatase (EEP) superfamily protein YafD
VRTHANFSEDNRSAACACARETDRMVGKTVPIALDVMGSAVVAATALPFVRKGYWWVRIWDFPRLQTAAVGALVLCGYLLWPPHSWAEWLIVAGLLSAVGYQAVRIYPFTPLAPAQVLSSENPAAERKLRLLVANVRAENRRVQPLLDLIAAARPDVVLTLEPDGFWQRALAVLDRDFPHRLKQPQDNHYGMLLFSRLELWQAQIRFLMDPEVPSFHAHLVLRSGDRVHLYAVHPRPPQTFQASFDRDAELLVIGREIHASPEPAIVAGDLNDVGWSHTTRLFQRMSGLMDPRLGRGLFSTFPATLPLLRWPLDHIFFDAEFRLCRLERLGFIGSDHFPILAELSFEPESAHEHEARAPMPDDRAAARRMIREGRAR